MVTKEKASTWSHFEQNNFEQNHEREFSVDLHVMVTKINDKKMIIWEEMTVETFIPQW